MFERYTEKARRTIFFARYEASTHGIKEIDTRCLMLGILREDKDLIMRLAPDHPNLTAALLVEVDALFPKPGETISPSTDLPLHAFARQALLHAANEASLRHHHSIEPRHLLWGVLNTGGPEVACLASHGLTKEVLDRDLASQEAPTAPSERRILKQMIDRIPSERLSAAGILLTGLAAGRFEAKGADSNGPFQFSFGG